MVKGNGGAIGITENEVALSRWMVAGPEAGPDCWHEDKLHTNKKRCSEQIPSVQKNFTYHVKGVVSAIEELENPFSETTKDLYTLDTKVI